MSFFVCLFETTRKLQYISKQIFVQGFRKIYYLSPSSGKIVKP